jgi:hypothetical protein
MMAIVRKSLMGATIRSVGCTIGLNGQASQLTISLVQDTANGDSFLPQVPGTPVFFDYGQLKFNGFFQKWRQKDAIDGSPTFEVIIIDPRELLEGVQLIISSYAGDVGGVYNLFNAFGWWENNEGFGSSFSNDSGMPWLKIRQALLSMCNTTGRTDYGGPIVFQGNAYALDLSEMPAPPMYYRLGGQSISLMEAISQICEDGGCDFFVELVGFTIKIRTINRLNQPPLGTISSLVNSFKGACTSSSHGVELRNEITSSFLVGGEQTRLNLTSSIYQFFGYDFSGFPITGVAGVQTLTDSNGVALQQVPVLRMTLNSTEVSDILGSVYYPCTTLELRLAKSDYIAWSSYMFHYRRDVADAIGLTVVNANMVGSAFAAVFGKVDIVNDIINNAFKMVNPSNRSNATSIRFYEFVRKVADEYYGRKYLVSIPFILRYQDPETLKVISSYDISGEGAYLPDGSAPLGLSPLHEDIFKNPDGRFRSFIEYTNLQTADLSSISPQGTALSGSRLFVEVQTDPSIVYLNGTPFALITLPAPLLERPVDSTGNVALMLAATLQMPNNAAAQQILRNTFFGGRISPEVLVPQFAAIPLRSNIFTYGPWYFAGAPGKVKFDYDPSMTPWNYGGYDELDFAGFSRVSSAASQMTYCETGGIDVPGIPIANLGDTMSSGGPNITDIDVQISNSGIISTYRFSTFTQRFGVFSRGNVERIKRLGLTNVSLRRSIRSALRIDLAKAEVLANAFPAYKAFWQNAPAVMKRNTPHDTFVSYSYFDPQNQSIRMTCQSATVEEAVGLSNADNAPAFRETAICSMNALFRPFSTLQGMSSYMPAFGTPEITDSSIPCLNSLNPFARPNDVDVYAWGASYQGLNAYRRGGDGSNARSLALRAPLLLSGFGFGIDTQLVPNDDRVVNLQRQDKWKVGPLDPLWDDKRGVWTCHGTWAGKTSGVIDPGGSGEFMVDGGEGGSDWPLTVWNYFSVGISGNTKGICNYVPNHNKYYVVAADCPSG